MAKEENEGSPTLCLTALPDDVNKSTLRTFFDDHGKVLDVIFKYGVDSKRIKGVAYVLFETQKSVDKLLELKTITINDTEVEMKEKRGDDILKGDEPLLAVPKEALNCHICKRDKFPSLEAFISHRKGKQHQALFRLFKAKSASVLQLLRSESKLASDRAYDISWLKRNPNFTKPQCEVCQVQINCNPARHKLSVEHKMVKNFINPKCCDVELSDRPRYNDHLLTLKHLKNVYDKSQQSELSKDGQRLTMKKAIDIYKQCDADLKELKETYGELGLDEEMPPFENKPVGMNYIVKKINYYCICCDQKFFAKMDLVEPHCRGYNHYTNMTEYITEIEKNSAATRNAPKRKLETPDEKPSKKQAVEVSAESKVKKELISTDEKKEIVVDKTPKKKKVEVNVKETVKEEGNEEQEESAKEVDDRDVEMADEEEEHEVDDEGIENEDEEMAEEEAQEDEEELQEESREEVGGDSDVQAEEDEGEVQALDPEPEVEEEEVVELEEEKKDSEVEKVVGNTPVEETTKDNEEEEEEEVVEIEAPKPTRTIRGRRARGRGRAIKR